MAVKPSDASMMAVLNHLIEVECFDHGDPGEVLYNLADAVSASYFDVAHSVQWLEELGWVEVERLYHSAPARGNRIVAIKLIDEEEESS